MRQDQIFGLPGETYRAGELLRGGRRGQELDSLWSRGRRQEAKVQQGKELDSLWSWRRKQEMEVQQDEKWVQLVQKEVRRSDHLCQEVRRLRK